MRPGIILIHGYTGSSEDLLPLSLRLSDDYGPDSVKIVSLSAHEKGDAPAFDRRTFMKEISLAVELCRLEGREIIMVGHSTGGTLMLSFLMEEKMSPAMVVLASVPRKIDFSYADRWEKHREGMKDVPFSSVAAMISVINSVSSKFSGSFPALIIHGKDDELVPCDEASEWEKVFDGHARSVIIPSAGHDIFRSANRQTAVDIIARAVRDMAVTLDKEGRIISRLSAVEPEVRSFLNYSPGSSRHIAGCPSAEILIGGGPVLPPVLKNGPVFANVEITTRCNLKCKYCSRSFLNKEGKDMPKEVFQRIIDSLPHAYRITLVGLGEPLLHPEITDIVSFAAGRGRRVALVTNAMQLDAPFSEKLIKAGLSSIAFSIDAAEQDMASELRTGTDLKRVIANIRNFVEIARSTRNVSIAVFSAVSACSVKKLPSLIDIVADLGVNVLMMTDLNFEQNVSDTLWKNINAGGIEIIRKTVSHAFSRKLPVLSVHGLEEFGLAERYRDFLLLPPDKLYSRSAKRTWCHSPWQTVPVNVQGDVTVCDCQPEKTIGNLIDQPISEIWNNEIMVEHRKGMLGDSPPKACSICPRF